MAQRSLLCIEPDLTTVGELRRSFGAYGFRVESIPNGEQAVEWARTHNPALIVLSVEPRKVGYAICNKLKRSPSLREIPLVLISAEETMATFEQHKKLKSRAEEYLLKPLDMADLLAKANRLVGLGDTQADARLVHHDDDIEIADEEISLDEEDALLEESVGFSDPDQPTQTQATGDLVSGSESDGIPQARDSLDMLGDLSRPAADPSGTSPFHDPTAPAVSGTEIPFDAEQFDQETQAAFAALEAGAAEGGDREGTDREGADGESTQQEGSDLRSLDLTNPDRKSTDRKSTDREAGPNGAAYGAGSSGSGSALTPSSRKDDEGVVAGGTAEMVDLQSLWGDEDLPSKLPWEEAPAASGGTAPMEVIEITDQYAEGPRTDMSGGYDPVAAQVTPPPQVAADAGSTAEDAELAGLGTDVPPLPEEVLYDERSNADAAARDQRIAELQGKLDALTAEKHASDGQIVELQGRISSLEAERQAVRKEQDEQRERMTQAASQGAFSKERDLLGLREIINKKEKDILDLRDALDAKERLILDHKDKIREHERARRDLEERTLGFEKSLMAANEKVQELAQDKEKSVEREKGLKARLDDAHEELRKGQDELEALRKRVAQEIERGRVEVDRTRIEWEAKFAEAEDLHRATLSKATDDWVAADAAEKAAHEADLGRLEAAHRIEVESLQRRLTEEVSSAADRLQGEVLKLRRDHEKAIASLKEEQALQLASEREAYETQTEAKHRAYRDEVMGLRRRHEEELTAAEDRRQRDILEQEQRRVAELEQAESRRRAELQARDEEHHARVTELERRHLIETTEFGERHRTEHDQAVGRAVRAEGELVARGLEIEQAYRRLAGFEADLDAARAELGNRDVKLSQMRDRVAELEAKAADYEDQIVRAFQRLRTDEKTTEKVRRALAVGLALLDERATGAAAQAQLKSAPVTEEAEKS